MWSPMQAALGGAVCCHLAQVSVVNTVYPTIKHDMSLLRRSEQAHVAKQDRGPPPPSICPGM